MHYTDCFPVVISNDTENYQLLTRTPAYVGLLPAPDAKKRKSNKMQIHGLSPFKPILETCSVVLTFESVVEILQCEHSVGSY